MKGRDNKSQASKMKSDRYVKIARPMEVSTYVVANIKWAKCGLEDAWRW